MNTKLVRLQKYIANCGVASRRKAEELILLCKVTVNKQVVNELGRKINPDTDVVRVDGKQIKPQKKRCIYYLTNPKDILPAQKTN